MFNQTKHRLALVNVLKDIYSSELKTLLGFKGGTAAMLFYHLPRLSVDLDFDLLDESKKDLVFETVKKIISKYGKIVEATDKRYTLFYLVSYKKGLRQLKIEISKIKGISKFEFQRFLGLSMLVMEKPDMFACKLSALITRKNFAMRDVFDVWYFFDQMWDINEKVLENKTNMALKKALKTAVRRVEKVKENQVLQGLGELLGSEKQKDWARKNLIREAIFQLKSRYS